MGSNYISDGNHTHSDSENSDLEHSDSDSGCTCYILQQFHRTGCHQPTTAENSNPRLLELLENGKKRTLP